MKYYATVKNNSTVSRWEEIWDLIEIVSYIIVLSVMGGIVMVISYLAFS